MSEQLSMSLKSQDNSAGRLRLAFMGMRGLPADLPKAGGGERETEAKTTRLASRGHQVTVYCRWHYNRLPATPYQGIHLISLPSIPNKNLDTVSHTLLATLHAWLKNTADILSYHGMGNGLFVPLAKLLGKKTVVYMDGIDWVRPKWGRLARIALKIAAGVSLRWADAVYVDNRVSQDQFNELFHKSPAVITLAADLWEDPGSDRLASFGLSPGDYILFVGLLKPDKGVHILIEAYEKLKTQLPLVIVGDSPDRVDYVHKLKSTPDTRVKFLGYVYGHDARQLFSNCQIYVQPSLMEGNSPALMSAMACGRCVVVSDIEQNLETLGGAGRSFQSENAESLRLVLEDLIANPKQAEKLGVEAQNRIREVYNWDKVVTDLEKLYYCLTRDS